MDGPLSVREVGAAVTLRRPNPGPPRIPVVHSAEPRTTLQSPLRWSESEEWKLDYCNAERLSAEELKRLRVEFDRGKEAAREIRESKLIA